MMLDLLAQIPDDAVEYGLLTANPARGKRRRLKVPKPGGPGLVGRVEHRLVDIAATRPRCTPATRPRARSSPPRRPDAVQHRRAGGTCRPPTGRSPTSAPARSPRVSSCASDGGAPGVFLTTLQHRRRGAAVLP
jgi:hypothetical protein